MDFKNDKKVLVTGGAGFIGSHLVERLVRNDYKVVVIDDLSSGDKNNLSSEAKFYKIDVRDKKISEIFKKEKPEMVFHLAAQPIVETAFKDPMKTLEVNIMGTVNVLEACRLKGDLKSVVICSSDKAYGKSKNLPYAEDAPLRGDHPYEVSKTAADLIAQTYFKTYNLPIVITRFGNTFGPRDVNFNRIIPGVLKAIIKNEELLIRSDGKMVREYVYVKDVAEGCIKLIQNIDKTKGEAFNFGSKNIFSVIDLIKKIEEILKVKVNYKILNIAKNEIPEQYLDWEKIKNTVNWRPETGFEEGIKDSFDWYKKLYSS